MVQDTNDALTTDGIGKVIQIDISYNDDPPNSVTFQSDSDNTSATFHSKTEQQFLVTLLAAMNMKVNVSYTIGGDGSLRSCTVPAR